MSEQNTHHHIVDIFQATLAGSVVGAGLGFVFFTGSLNTKTDLALLVRETALCSTICAATAGISAFIHNRMNEGRREQVEKAGSEHRPSLAR